MAKLIPRPSFEKPSLRSFHYPHFGPCIQKLRPERESPDLESAPSRAVASGRENFQLPSRRAHRQDFLVQIIPYLLVAVAGYLAGSLPTGYLAARARGIDIRTVGSKNMGATNVFRVLGKGPGILVLFVDALKGFAAVAWIAPALLGVIGAANPTPPNSHVLAGISAVLGHNYTCWLQFKGGKGIATTAGVYVALAPLSVSLALGVWILLFFATRYVSVGSIAAAIALPAAVWVTERSLLLGLVTTGLGVMAIYKHKANIQRLLNGTENRIQFKKEKPEA